MSKSVCRKKERISKAREFLAGNGDGGRGNAKGNLFFESQNQSFKYEFARASQAQSIKSMKIKVSRGLKKI